MPADVEEVVAGSKSLCLQYLFPYLPKNFFVIVPIVSFEGLIKGLLELRPGQRFDVYFVIW